MHKNYIISGQVGTIWKSKKDFLYIVPADIQLSPKMRFKYKCWIIMKQKVSSSIQSLITI